MPMEYIGTDWEATFEPLVTRKFADGDLWPFGPGSDSGGGDKNTVVDGNHPFLAVGEKAARPNNLVGVVVTVDADTGTMELAVQKNFAAKAQIMNVLTYSAGSPATFETSLAIGQPVFVDDSDDLPTDVTLSLSPLNDLDAKNPLAGWIFYEQTEYDDIGVGGAGASRTYPYTIENELTEVGVVVMLAGGPLNIGA